MCSRSKLPLHHCPWVLSDHLKVALILCVALFRWILHRLGRRPKPLAGKSTAHPRRGLRTSRCLCFHRINWRFWHDTDLFRHIKFRSLSSAASLWHSSVGYLILSRKLCCELLQVSLAASCFTLRGSDGYWAIKPRTGHRCGLVQQVTSIVLYFLILLLILLLLLQFHWCRHYNYSIICCQTE